MTPTSDILRRLPSLITVGFDGVILHLRRADENSGALEKLVINRLRQAFVAVALADLELEARPIHGSGG